MRWCLAILVAAAAATLVASEDSRCPAPRVWPSQLDDVAFDDTRPRLGCVADQCEPCLGPEWDPLREVKGLLDVKRDRSVRSTSRSSPRPTLEKMLTSRSFHTLQSSALDKLRRRKRGECKGDTSGKSDWCRETVFPELYFGGLVEALEEHMADGDLVFPEGK